MARLNVKVQGEQELIRALGKLEPALQRKHVRSALRAGAKIIRAESQRRAPNGESGLIRKSIKVKAGKRRKGGISILVTIGDALFTGKSFYGAFLEFGFKRAPTWAWKAFGTIFFRSRKVAKETKRKPVAGLHFMQKALEVRGAEAGKAVTDYLWRAIRGEVGKKR